MEFLFCFLKKRDLLIQVVALVLMIVVFNTTSTQADPNPFQFTASVSTDLQLTISGGNNERGKRTLLMGDSIQFGQVSFVQPETISTGDAYLDNGSLMLEAILDVNTVFNGTNQVRINLNKYSDSSNPFNEIYYSLSTSRAQSLEKVQTSPAKNPLKTIRRSSEFSLRVVFEIAPQQKGDFYDRLKLEALPL